MIEAAFLIACFVVSRITNKAGEFLNILFLSILSVALYFLSTDDFIYNASLTVSYALSLYLTQSKLIRLSLTILIFYSVIAFLLDVADLFIYSQMTWQLVESWANLYAVIYYCTIILMFAGLAIKNDSGHRDNSASSDLCFIDNNGANIKRI